MECPNGKRCYARERDAKTAAADMRIHQGEHMTSYHCKLCPWWHLATATKRPPYVRHHRPRRRRRRDRDRD